MVSFVWSYFTKSKDNSTAKCDKCKSDFKTKGSSTTSLISHLEKKHGIKKEDTENLTKKSNYEPPEKKLKQSKLSFMDVKPSRAQIFSEMAAKDGITINQILKSKTIANGLKYAGYEVPKSANTIIKEIYEFYEEKQEEIITNITKLKNSGEKWSISFDEWTSRRGRRYLNINLHNSKDEPICLGLVHVLGSLTAERTQKLIRDRLLLFNLNLDTDIVASLCDGAKVNIKYSRQTPTETQICLAHGIHLAVTDVLYKKPPNNMSLYSDEANENDKIDDSS
jgi:hypothetical protein